MLAVQVALLVLLQFRPGLCDSCPGSTLADQLRNYVLGVHNDYRFYVNYGFNIFPDNVEYPKAENMYVLRWSCGLEKLATKAVEGCPDKKPENPLYASNILHLTKDDGYSEEELADPLGRRITDFAKERFRHGWGNMVVNFTGPEDLRPLANIYRAVTLSVGCSQQTCRNTATAVCFYSKPELGNGQLIYRAGTPCQSNGDCTTYPRSTCNATETLCHTQSFEAVPEDKNERCSSNTGMTDRLREQFLMMHNYRRSRMALGKVKNFKGESFPEAANMEKMVYNCDLEADAMIYAETCALGRSYPGTRKGQGENVAVVEPQNATSYEEAAQFAMRSWYSPIRGNNSIDIKDVTFRRKHIFTPVARATLILWSTTNKVGCAIGKCGGSYFVVCRYSPRGNRVGHAVYKQGIPCSQCRGRECDTAVGLCVTP